MNVTMQLHAKMLRQPRLLEEQELQKDRRKAVEATGELQESQNFQNNQENPTSPRRVRRTACWDHFESSFIRLNGVQQTKLVPAVNKVGIIHLFDEEEQCKNFKTKKTVGTQY